MAQLITSLTRTDQKTQRVVHGLRKRIIDGSCSPGEQLPTWGDLESDFGVGRATVARALVQLKKEGFVFSDSTRGTFVSHRPPHTYRYGLVFPRRPGDTEWNRHWWMLANESAVVAREHDCEMVCFYDISGDLSQSHDWEQLCSDVDSCRLAGLILVGASAFVDKLASKELSMPCIAIGSPDEQLNVPVVSLDTQSFFGSSVGYLCEQNVSRIGLLAASTDQFKSFEQAMRGHALEVDPTITLATSASDPTSAYHAMRLLASLPKTQLPQAMIIADDNLTAHAYRGLLDAGLTLPREMKIVTLCNWPTANDDVLATCRIGFDSRNVLQQCLECIDQWRGGEKIARVSMVKPVFEQDLPRLNT